MFLTGRAQEFVKKGAVKIALREIDEVLGRHPAVIEAAAVGVDDEYLGTDIVACVVLRPDSTATPAELLAFCERELGSFRTPARIDIVDALPKGPLGKIERGRLPVATPRPAMPSRPRSGPNVPPVVLPPVEQAVADAWRSVLGLETIGLHDDYFRTGGDSLQLLRILVRLRQTLPVSLTFGMLVEHPTIAAQARLIDQALLAQDDALSILEEVEKLSDTEAARRLVEGRDVVPSDGSR
jgi:aryl carrier-like protein